MATYYRVVDIMHEPVGSVQTSERRSDFRQMAIDMLPLSNCVCNFANSAGLTILSASQVAVMVPVYVDVINDFRQTGQTKFDLSQILVNNPTGLIDFDLLFNFACDYVDKVNSIGKCFEHYNTNVIWEYVWELVRANEYPQLPSRLESVFFFASKSEAQNYKDSIWKDELVMRVVEIDTNSGATESYDMSWFSDVETTATYQEAKDYARNYWEKKATSHSVWEVLYQGTYTIKK